MSMTVERMLYWLRKELGGLDEGDLPEEDGLDLLNQSLWALEDTFPFRAKETNGTIDVVEGTNEYALSGLTRLDALHSLSYVDDEGVPHKLARMTQDWYDANHLSSEESYGNPVRYLRRGDTLLLSPIPDEDFTLRVVYRQSVASLLAASTSSGLPRNWDEIVLYGAAWRGHKQIGGDYNMAQQAANFQIGLIRAAVPTEAKEERDSRYARVNVIHEFPEEELEGYEG